MNKVLLVIMLFFAIFAKSQEATVIPPQQVPTQNLVKFNRFLFNPTFSRVGLKNSYISLYTRNQWVQFEDAPTIYMINYASRVNNNTGVGLGIQQQSNGVLNYFGINANYSYGVQFAENTWLTVGLNFNYFESGLKSTTTSVMSDPLIANYEESKLLGLKPGFNLTLNRFDIGFYAENLIGYNLRSNEQTGGLDIYSAHLMYTQPLGKSKNNFARAIFRARNDEFDNLVLSGNILVDIEKYGWGQLGYNDFYGGSIGIGVNITPNISIGYLVEKGLSDATDNLGVTHELNLIYRFRDVSNEVVSNEEDQLDEDDYLSDSTEAYVKNESNNNESKSSATDLTRLEDEINVNKILIEELMLKQEELEKSMESQTIGIIALSKSKLNTSEVRPVMAEAPIEKNIKTISSAKSSNNFTDKKAPSSATASSSGSISRESVNKLNKERPKLAKKTLDNYAPGFYLIGNVYKGDNYANLFKNKLKEKGFNRSEVIQNSKNKLRYVALENYESLESAEKAYYSDLEGKYGESMWILEIKNSSSAIAERNKVKLEISKPDNLAVVDKDRASSEVKAEEYVETDSVKKSKIDSDTNSPNQLISPEKQESLIENYTAETNKESNLNTESEVMNSPVSIAKSNTTYDNPPEKRIISDTQKSTLIKKEPSKVSDDQVSNSFVESKESASPMSEEQKANSNSDELDKDIKAILKLGQESGITKGYYIVANVFSTKYYHNKFLKKLKNSNIQSDSFKNPNNNWNYVYLGKYENLDEAKVDYSSNMSGKYNDSIWILKVE